MEDSVILIASSDGSMMIKKSEIEGFHIGWLSDRRTFPIYARTKKGENIAMGMYDDKDSAVKALAAFSSFYFDVFYFDKEV